MSETKAKRGEYRSSRRSRALIRNALLQLMRDKDYDQITITEVARKADINRGTFYAHYKNLGEVLESLQNDIAGQLAQIFQSLDFPRKGLAGIEQALEDCVAFIKKDPEYIRALLSMEKGGSVQNQWKEAIIAYFDSAVVASGRISRMTPGYKCAVRFVVDGTIDCILDSLTGKSGLRLEDLPKELSRIMKAVLAPYADIL